MRLVDLEPTFIRYERLPDGHEVYHEVNTVFEAHGIRFLCPACFEKNNGAVGTHGILCWFRERGIPDNVDPGPGRWVVSGRWYSDLTLSPSVSLQGGCAWHGFVQNGNVETCH